VTWPRPYRPSPRTGPPGSSATSRSAPRRGAWRGRAGHGAGPVDPDRR
jgi:hypothetical protein